MKKRILHILKSNKYSGAENVACQVINMFRKNKDYEMFYVSPEGQIAETLKEKDIKYIPIKNLSYLELKRVIKEYKPDIIHAHDKSAILFASIFATKKRKVVAHVHCTFDILTTKNLKSFIFNCALKRCKKVVFVSKQTYETYAYKNDLENKSVVLRNMIDVNEIEQKASKDTNDYDIDIIFLGRLAYQKNPERLLDVIESVYKKNKDLKVAIVGDGELKDKVVEIIKSKSLENTVKVYGFLNNPYKMLKQSKLLLMTSRNEGTPMVALESMALGLPIISTPVDGMKDLIINGRNGYLSDENEDLVTYITNIIENKVERLKISEEAKKVFEEKNNIKKYEDDIRMLYED